MVNRTLHLLSSSSLFSSSTWFVPRCRLKAAFQPPTGTPPSGGSAMRTNCRTVVFIRSQPAFPSGQARAQERAFLMTEMLVALAILLGALLPLAYSLVSEKRLARAVYQRAVAMELVDGEMEILAAGEWRAMPA